MKQEIKQANFRLPEDLLTELKEISDKTAISQTVIVRQAVSEKINALKQISAEKEIALSN